MHEYSIANSLIDVLLEQIRDKGITAKVQEVHLRKGELRIVSEEALKQAYSILAEETVLEGSKLMIEEVKTQVECSKCGYSGGIEYHDDLVYHFTAPILECPRCGAPVEIKEGRELDLVRLIVKDGE